MTSQYSVVVNTNASSPIRTGYTFVQGDKGISFRIIVNELDFASTSAKIVFHRANGTSVESAASYAGNVVSYTTLGNEFEVPGIVVADIKFYSGDTQRVSTASFIFNVNEDTLDGLGGGTAGYSDELEVLRDQLEEESALFSQTLQEYIEAFGDVGAIHPAGDWDNATEYHVLDLVWYNGASWLAKLANTNQTPQVGSAYWQQFTSATAAGTSYDNTSSGLSATDVQDAIDETVGKVGDVNDAITAITNVYNAKNLLPNEAVSASYYGGTFTPNADGSIVVSGTTATADIYFPILATATSKWYPQTGSYLLSGGNATAKIRLDAYNGNTYIKTLGISPSYESVTVDYDGYDHVRPFVFVGNGTDLSTSVTVYPMLRDSRIPDATYVPFCYTNRQLLSYKDNGVLGCKNLLENKAVSQMVNGVTFTVNADKSISTSGTASTTFQFGINVSANYYNPKSFYPYYGGNILNGCTGGSDSTYFLYIDYSEDGVTWGGHAVATDGDVLIESNHAYYSQCAIYINSGTNMDGKTFKPMIRLATDTDPTYQPYAMTNREITEKIISGYIPVEKVIFQSLKDGSKTIRQQIDDVMSQFQSYLASHPNTAYQYASLNCAGGNCVPVNLEVLTQFYGMQFMQIGIAGASLYLRTVQASTSNSNSFRGINSFSATDESTEVAIQNCYLSVNLYRIV